MSGTHEVVKTFVERSSRLQAEGGYDPLEGRRPSILPCVGDDRLQDTRAQCRIADKGRMDGRGTATCYKAGELTVCRLIHEAGLWHRTSRSLGWMVVQHSLGFTRMHLSSFSSPLSRAQDSYPATPL